MVNTQTTLNKCRIIMLGMLEKKVKIKYMKTITSKLEGVMEFSGEGKDFV